MKVHPLAPPRILSWAWTLGLALATATLATVQAAPGESARIREFERSLLPAFQIEGQPEQRWTLEERMAHWNVPGVSVAVIRGGKVVWAKGYGVLQAGKPEPVDTETMFSVGSVSKVGAAATTLRLVDAGKLDLDRDVNTYLRTWKVPASPFLTKRPVTLRGILSHTAGLSVHGFADFQPGEALPTTIQILDGLEPAKNEPVRVIYPPGSRSQYSGGGTTLEQLIVEEATGLSFPQAARQQVFEPLGMSRSTYENPVPESHGNIAKAHGPDGQPRALPRGYEAMPEMAASGLWSTPSDYAKLVIALIESYQDKSGSFLSGPLARQMMTAVGPSRAGLGPFLDGQGTNRRFSHDGANDSYRALTEGHLATGNGVVIFTNGTQGNNLYPEIRRAVAQVEGWSEALSDYRRISTVKLPEAELSDLSGVYEAEGNDYRYQIIQRGDVLYRRALGGKDRMFPLVALDTSHFFEAHGAATYQFLRNYEGKVEAMQVKGSDDPLRRKVSDAPKGDDIPIELN